MNYYTLFYSFLIIFILFKNIIFEKIIDFNEKNNTEDILNNLRNMNHKYTLILLLLVYVIYKSTFIYRLLFITFSVIIYYYYTDINYLLNQLKNIYNNQFLINKFILL
jgi:hypothetical protein